MEEFYRIKRLPPYVFETVNKAKAVARNQGADIALPTGLDLERESFIACATSADFDEGRRAFIERRAPVFSGR